jgi:hypothetical protein
MKSCAEQWDKLYSIGNSQSELELVYMWVKQGVIDKSTFIKMVEFVFDPST